ncbi:formate dehydrogenase [Desulfosarcina ovata subsp. sediminis]|uniref:Formate dehydrogenase n=1 Tax=Desulfosarcina ovata subsp. sediminis TaxID=885957 RepID=A0A5K7ZQE4_9BACT|nr:molybdopterin oxidoreductase family protein [Desulfosarcina ovata]BBO81790.1 formate dehydrogenase [Desulfosarcina ovata subsp. sediminis]
MALWKRSVCTKDCPDTCGLLVRVEDGRITVVKGDPDHPITRGFICRKAKYFPEHVHHAERIVTPLKRTGPKGSGQFSPISWDAALDEIAGRMTAVVDRYGPQAILPYYYAGHMGMIHRHAGHALFHCLGASRMIPTICGPAASAGFEASLGRGPSTAISASVNSDFIVVWGSNTLTTNLHAWPFFQQARKKGARLTVIDPYRTETARRADVHLMIRPGTDAALALAVMNVLIAEGLIDHDFIEKRTVGFDPFSRRAAEYPPERAADICGIDAEAIRSLALGYGRANAPYIRTGWGPARQLGGAMAMRTIALLPALVGAFTRPGAGITRSLGGAPANLTFLTRPDLCPAATRKVNMVHLGRALTELDGPPIKYLHVYLSNPAAVAPQSQMVMTGLAREDLFVSVQEMFMTDTARMADIILPGASFFEVKDLYRAYGHNCIQLAEPVIPPVGESRSTLAIFQALARRMGFANDVFSMTEDQCVERLLQDPSPYMAGVDLDRLRHGRAACLNIPDSPFADRFNTPSGKVEFFSRQWAEMGLDPLPDGRPMTDPDAGERFPLAFITPPHRLFLNSAFNEIDALRQAAGPPTVLIHPKAAGDRNIADGQMVRVFNSRGECRLTARVTADTRPGLLVAEGIHWPMHHEGGRGANQLTGQRLTDAGQTCAFHASRVEVAPLCVE